MFTQLKIALCLSYSPRRRVLHLNEQIVGSHRLQGADPNEDLLQCCLLWMVLKLACFDFLVGSFQSSCRSDTPPASHALSFAAD